MVDFLRSPRRPRTTAIDTSAGPAAAGPCHRGRRRRGRQLDDPVRPVRPAGRRLRLPVRLRAGLGPGDDDVPSRRRHGRPATALATALRGRIRYSCECAERAPPPRASRSSSPTRAARPADPCRPLHLHAAAADPAPAAPRLRRRGHVGARGPAHAAGREAGPASTPSASGRPRSSSSAASPGPTSTSGRSGTPRRATCPSAAWSIGYYNFAGDAESYGSLAPEERVARAVETGRRVHGHAYARRRERRSPCTGTARPTARAAGSSGAARAARPTTRCSGSRPATSGSPATTSARSRPGSTAHSSPRGYTVSALHERVLSD